MSDLAQQLQALDTEVRQNGGRLTYAIHPALNEGGNILVISDFTPDNWESKLHLRIEGKDADSVMLGLRKKLELMMSKLIILTKSKWCPGLRCDLPANHAGDCVEED